MGLSAQNCLKAGSGKEKACRALAQLDKDARSAPMFLMQVGSGCESMEWVRRQARAWRWRISSRD